MLLETSLRNASRRLSQLGKDIAGLHDCSMCIWHLGPALCSSLGMASTDNTDSIEAVAWHGKVPTTTGHNATRNRWRILRYLNQQAPTRHAKPETQRPASHRLASQPMAMKSLRPAMARILTALLRCRDALSRFNASRLPTHDLMLAWSRPDPTLALCQKRRIDNKR